MDIDVSMERSGFGRHRCQQVQRRDRCQTHGGKIASPPHSCDQQFLGSSRYHVLRVNPKEPKGIFGKCNNRPCQLFPYQMIHFIQLIDWFWKSAGHITRTQKRVALFDFEPTRIEWPFSRQQPLALKAGEMVTWCRCSFEGGHALCPY